MNDEVTGGKNDCKKKEWKLAKGSTENERPQQKGNNIIKKYE